jgi:putative ABC transport system permease protein
MIQDFKFAFRQLLKSPGFSVVAISTLALAIGVNSAIFALINGAVLRPMVPVRPQEMVNVYNCRQNANHDYRSFSYNEYRELRENPGDLFSDLAVLEFAVAGIGRDHEMRRSFAFVTSENYFPMMGIQPFRGRFYNAEECKPNANISVVVASYGFWKRQGARNDFVGSTLYINGQPYTVIGISPKGFCGASAIIAPDVWIPLGMRAQLGSAFGDSENMHDLTNPKNYCFNMVGRMRSDLTIDSAKSRLPVISQRFNAMQVDAEFQREVQIKPPSRFDLSTSPEDEGPITLIGTMLMAMAGAVLLIACLNLANMLLARGTSRSKEIAVRLAVGASRWRIVRQLLAEGLLLAICGGVVGLVLSVWCNNLLLNSFAVLLNNINFSFIIDLSPDGWVIAATFLFCLIATLLFSLGPALKATKADLVNDLKQQVGEPARIGRFSRFFAPRHISVMVQIALSLMLLFAAGLFFRGAMKAAGLNPGFVAAGDLVTEMDFTLVKKDPAESRREIFNIIQRARELPGVTAVGVGTMLPYGNFTNGRRIMSTKSTLSNDPKAPDPGASSLWTATTPGYFDSIGVKILRGRDFTQAECENKEGRQIGIIDELMAKKLFPNEDAIGQHVRYTIPPKDGSPNDIEIVGIVNTHYHDVQEETRSTGRLFVPYAQGYTGDGFLHVRLNTKDRKAVAGMMSTVNSMLRNIDPDIPIIHMAPYVDLLDGCVGLWIVRMGAVLFGAFGCIALLLAVVGVYGVKAYAVACRTREIGIRMALGAHRKDVFALIMRQGALQTALAISAGVLLSLAIGRVLSQILYGVSPSDPFALISSSLLLAAAALLACFLPARRATYVNPITALRTE